MQEATAEYRISIRSLLLRPDEKRTVSREIDAETAAGYGIPCAELPKIDGVLENRAGVLMMRYRLHCVTAAFPPLQCISTKHSSM